MSDYGRTKKFRVSPVLISIIFIITFMFCVCYFVVGFDIIWKFTVGLCLVLIEYWYYTLLLLTFITGFCFLNPFTFDEEGNKCGAILIFGSVIIFLILAVYEGFQLKKEKENMQQEQTQAEIVQSEKE